MGVFDFMLGCVGANSAPTVYKTTRRGKRYIGETGKGVEVRYDCNDEERLNVDFTFTSLMTRKERIVVEEALMADERARGVVIDNYDRHSKQKKRGRR